MFFYHQQFSFSPALDKRPAGLQYLAYGMVITHLLFKVVPNKSIRVFNYISVNSMEINTVILSLFFLYLAFKKLFLLILNFFGYWNFLLHLLVQFIF